ncbi:hypothetical protein Q8A67_011750 [Cirrhinus molitorella]|uniref:Uncharacterized protein n=1 Tax=Cirrhinus molitorella TaxID=172907 RepID=A0AA88PSM7_9TELE|nr:hypothetical protein Q8A67_011750 [Cirrhinus molitorella]
MTLAARLDDLETTLEHMLMDVFYGLKTTVRTHSAERHRNRGKTDRKSARNTDKEGANTFKSRTRRDRLENWWEGAVETERKRGTARLSVAGQQTPNACGPDAHTHTMVVQAAVTPGRTRRLLLKLPVGTLRRNSEERSSPPLRCHSLSLRPEAVPSDSLWFFITVKAALESTVLSTVSSAEPAGSRIHPLN